MTCVRQRQRERERAIQRDSHISISAFVLVVFDAVAVFLKRHLVVYYGNVAAKKLKNGRLVVVCSVEIDFVVRLRGLLHICPKKVSKVNTPKIQRYQYNI